MSTENALLTILIEKINNDTLVLPTLPEMAVKVRKAADDPDVNLNQMGDIIAQDPSLSARMIKVANSAFLGRTVKVTTLNQAVTRIGLRQIKNIATAMAMEQLFVSNNDLVKEYMEKSWQKNLAVAAYAIALLKFYVQQNKHTNLNIDTITLAALVHNIGTLPILTEAERHPEVFANPTFLTQAIGRLGGRIGGAIMRAWGFADEFVTVAENWSNLTYQSDAVNYVDFVRIGAIQEGVLSVPEPTNTLLEYVEKGVISEIDLLTSDEFNSMLSDVKSALS